MDLREPDMLKRSLLFHLVLIGSLCAQLQPPAAVQNQIVDFGGTSGTWGHFQYHRPYGARGILIQDWKDLTTLHPMNGEFLNTEIRGWYPADSATSYWDLVHPRLVASEDSLAPSVMVNYKQGDGDFSDFSVWYQNSLGPSTRYGWTSKLRSHQRFMGVNGYYDQRHRLSMLQKLDKHDLELELNYTSQVNPMYLFEVDSTTLLPNYREDYTVRSDRWSGSLRLFSNDSSDANSELIVWLEGGIWDWYQRERNTLSSMAMYSRSLRMGSLPELQFKIGLFNGQMGDYSSTRIFGEIKAPLSFGEKLRVDLGLRNVGLSDWLPIAKVQLKLNWFDLRYETKHLMLHQLWEPAFTASTIHHLHAGISSSWLNPYLGAWSGNAGDLSGYYAGFGIQFPWWMTLNVKGSELATSEAWVWTMRQVEWDLNQDFVLFRQALVGNLKIWGRHLFDPQQGYLNPTTLIASPSLNNREESVLNLLNYTISGQISSLVIAYTGSNFLHDPSLGSIMDLTWDTDFALMNNQASNTRFRYLTLIWVFEN